MEHGARESLRLDEADSVSARGEVPEGQCPRTELASAPGSLARHPGVDPVQFMCGSVPSLHQGLEQVGNKADGPAHRGYCLPSGPIPSLPPGKGRSLYAYMTRSGQKGPEECPLKARRRIGMSRQGIVCGDTPAWAGPSPRLGAQWARYQGHRSKPCMARIWVFIQKLWNIKGSEAGEGWLNLSWTQVSLLLHNSLGKMPIKSYNPEVIGILVTALSVQWWKQKAIYQVERSSEKQRNREQPLKK